ncbi:MAG: hypothetical protein ILM98_07505 [Kiritimatiellae bacterium]|nr:hypothetical protein [Kiritimatiellia bacterium]
MANNENGIYAGDKAWRDWFDICSVAGCPDKEAKALRRQITAMLFFRLASHGIGQDAVGGEDPVAFFDSYFLLKGCRDKSKPLKSYFAHRIKAEGIAMRDFVCGTLFGAAQGRVRDIVVEWIALLKGWKPRTVRADDGRRHFAWENASDADLTTLEAPEGIDPATLLDVSPLRAELLRALGAVAGKISVEKQKVALLLYVTAQDVPVTNPAVLDGLQTAKSRAYVLRDKAIAALRKELAQSGWIENPLTGRILLEVCEAEMPADVREKLERSE